MLLGGGGEGQPPNDEGKAASWRDGRRQRRRMSIEFGVWRDKVLEKSKLKSKLKLDMFVDMFGQKQLKLFTCMCIYVVHLHVDTNTRTRTKQRQMFKEDGRGGQSAPQVHPTAPPPRRRQPFLFFY